MTCLGTLLQVIIHASGFKFHGLKTCSLSVQGYAFGAPALGSQQPVYCIPQPKPDILDPLRISTFKHSGTSGPQFFDRSRTVIAQAGWSAVGRWAHQLEVLAERGHILDHSCLHDSSLKLGPMVGPRRSMRRSSDMGDAAKQPQRGGTTPGPTLEDWEHVINMKPQILRLILVPLAASLYEQTWRRRVVEAL